MKVIFVRHGKADYSIVDDKQLNSIETNFSPLCEKSVYQVEETAIDERLAEGRLIISSPYTRALQTAEIINRKLQLPLKVEYDLHEWKPDLEGSYLSREDVDHRVEEYFSMEGEYPPGEQKPWERREQIRKRVRSVIMKYEAYAPLIVVCHGIVIHSQASNNPLPFAGILEFDY